MDKNLIGKKVEQMIDEKKLMFERPENRNPNQKGFEEFNIGWNKCNEKWIEIINGQPQVANDTNVGSRREWYQKGYQDGLNADKWIPCSERLPSESNYYMACIYNADVDDFDFRKTWFAHVDDYDIEESEWRELYDFEEVTAWTNLPQPYKKEGAE